MRQQAHEIVAANVDHMTRPQSLGGHFIRLGGKRGYQSENFARLGDPQNQSFSFAGAYGELHFSFAKQEDSLRFLLLHEKDGAFRISGTGLHQLKLLDGVRRNLAKESGFPELANLTALVHLETIRSTHFNSPSLLRDAGAALPWRDTSRGVYPPENPRRFHGEYRPGFVFPPRPHP